MKSVLIATVIAFSLTNLATGSAASAASLTSQRSGAVGDLLARNAGKATDFRASRREVRELRRDMRKAGTSRKDRRKLRRQARKARRDARKDRRAARRDFRSDRRERIANGFNETGSTIKWIAENSKPPSGPIDARATGEIRNP